LQVDGRLGEWKKKKLRSKKTPGEGASRTIRGDQHHNVIAAQSLDDLDMLGTDTKWKKLETRDEFKKNGKKKKGS